MTAKHSPATSLPKLSRVVGQRCSYAGLPATITRVLDYSPSMVEIRVPGGISAVCFSDLRELGEAE